MAIVITGVIAAMGYGVFASLIDQRAVIREVMVDAEQTVALRETLEDWFTHSNVNMDDQWYLRSPMRGGPSIAGRQGITGWTDNDMLDLETKALTPSMGWGTVIRLFIDDDPRTPERGLAIRYLPISSPAEAGAWASILASGPAFTLDETARKLSRPPLTKELDARVTGLRVELLDSTTHRWYRRPQPVAPSNDLSPQGLPLAMRVILEGAPNTPLPPLLRLPFIIARPDRVKW